MKHEPYTIIANHTGISISHISRVLRRKRKPSLRVLLLLATEMDIPIDKLIKKLGLHGVNK